jgi:enoyl-CoA hydratase
LSPSTIHGRESRSRRAPAVGITTEKPIIAVASGWCIAGGLVIAMRNLSVAAESARFSYPEGKIGITGSTIAGLAARIPEKLAMELMLLGEPITA